MIPNLVVSDNSDVRFTFEREVIMKQRIIAILLVLCLFVGLIPTAFADSATLENSVDLDLLVAHGISLFKALEAGGKYDSITNTSAGCVGMGIMGWIGSSALQLLKWACAGNPEYCQSVLGDNLYYEVVNAPVAIASTKMPPWGYWRYRTFSAEELTAAKTLLGSDTGINAQNTLARIYLLSQAQHGWNAGVRTESALLYYCSAENHYGEGGVKNFMTSVRNALGISSTTLIQSLDMFHQGAVAANVDTINYRIKVYNYLVNTLHLPSGPDSSTVPFTDMPPVGHWAYDAIVWAYTSTPQITGGTGDGTTFSPDATLTRAEAMTFLWAAAGRPSPTSSKNPFKDVGSNAYYYKAVLWAVEKGYTAGTGDGTTFSPKSTVSVGEMLTFLWAFAGHPKSIQRNNPFSDVSGKKYYYEAVLWAYNGGILVGNEGSGSKLLPEIGCTRAYVVTYLYNYFVMTAP